MIKTFQMSVTALAVATSLTLFTPTTLAGNSDGSLGGQIISADKSPLANATITIKNNSTGFNRTIEADGLGNFRFGKLPVGNYQITVTKNGFETVNVEKYAVHIGSSAIDIPMYQTGTEVISVSGTRMAAFDITSSESALNIGDVEIARLPMGRDLTSVALLAPGASKGDSRFGSLASFGGASVAENAYMVNGLNVTDFRNGLGGSTIPFEFYKEFQIKTGGYSAEFGRSTGGVINAITKSGSNDWEYGANVYYTPSSLAEQNPDIRLRNGEMKIYNGADSYDKVDANVYLSGPIIEDQLFFYLLYNPRNIQEDYAWSTSTQFSQEKSDDAFWGGKVDWHIGDNHLLEVTGFSDKRTTVVSTWDYDYKTGEKSGKVSADESRGGKNMSVKYTGYLSDDFTLSALWGKNEADLNDVSEFDGNPVIYDKRSGSWQVIGDWANFTVDNGKDTREALRIDGEYLGFDDHAIRFGWDSETNTSIAKTSLSGGIYYAYFAYQPGDKINVIDYTFDQAAQVVRTRQYDTGGEFETLSNAFYIEDTWSINNDITATIGVRSESFDNQNAQGASFIKIDNQIAPRLGITWDVNSDGESKLFANYGRYHLPIAANTNIRMAGAETYIHNYYLLDSVNGDDTPNYDPATLLGTQVNGDGSIPDVREVLDSSIKPMYQDELILGYQANLAERWSYGIKYTHRDLKSVIDDVALDHIISANGWTEPGDTAYVLTNPGSAITTYFDTDGDGTLEQVTISAEQTQMPQPSRKYHSLDFNLTRSWDSVWSMNATYTWAHSYGNAEGSVKSDTGQDDAGLTTDWDHPYLMDGAYGNLPNDRRHTFKVYGAYALTENLNLGYNFLLQSGRPQNGFGGGLPQGYGEDYDGNETYYIGENSDIFSPRGSFGRTPWISSLDLSLKYTMTVGESDVVLAMDVFNVFDSQNVARIDETQYDSDSGLNAEFLMPSLYQSARSVQLSASVRF